MNIKHTAESWRRISCEAAAADGTDTSPEEGSDRSTYKVCSLKDETGCRLEALHNARSWICEADVIFIYC